MMRKGQDIKVLPEEKAALQQLQKYIQIYVNTGEIELSKILQLITNKKVFINQFATEFYKLTKQYIKEKSVIQIFYVIDFICKSELKAFREAIKPYIVKLFLRVYKNQKEFGCDLILLKTIFKSWFHIFPIQTLIDIVNKVQTELRDDLDQLPQEKIMELRKFYKNENVVGYENFLNGTYKKTSAGLTKKVKPNPQLNEDLQGQQNHIKIQPTHKQSHPQRIMPVQQQQQQPSIQQMPLQNNQIQPQTQQQQQQQPFYPQYQQMIPNNQFNRNIPYHINSQYNTPYQQQNAFQSSFPQLNPQPQINNQVSQYSFLPPQIPQIQPLQNNQQQQQMQHNQLQNQKPTNQPIVTQQKQAPMIALPLDPQSTTVFGSLFLYFTDQLANKQDFGNKDNVKEFLKKQVPSGELLSNPNKYSTLMKCPTCFMRFRNQAAYVQHLTNHAVIKLEKLNNEGKKESEMSCSVEQWMQSNTDTKDKKNQEKNISIVLDKLNSQSCVFCLEKFNGKWDSKNCQWVYENVRNYLLESNDLDEPQTISIHQKCNDVLSEFNI